MKFLTSILQTQTKNWIINTQAPGYGAWAPKLWCPSKIRAPCQIWRGTKVLVSRHHSLGAWVLIIQFFVLIWRMDVRNFIPNDSPSVFIQFEWNLVLPWLHWHKWVQKTKKNLLKNGGGTIVMVLGTKTLVPPNVHDWLISQKFSPSAFLGASREENACGAR